MKCTFLPIGKYLVPRYHVHSHCVRPSPRSFPRPLPLAALKLCSLNGGSRSPLPRPLEATAVLAVFMILTEVSTS